MERDEPSDIEKALMGETGLTKKGKEEQAKKEKAVSCFLAAIWICGLLSFLVFWVLGFFALIKFIWG